MRTITFDSLPTMVGELQQQVQQLQQQVQQLQHEPPPVELINGRQLCKRLQISEPTLIRWREAGRIPYLAIGGAYRYDLNAVIKALKQGGTHE